MTLSRLDTGSIDPDLFTASLQNQTVLQYFIFFSLTPLNIVNRLFAEEAATPVTHKAPAKQSRKDCGKTAEPGLLASGSCNGFIERGVRQARQLANALILYLPVHRFDRAADRASPGRTSQQTPAVPGVLTLLFLILLPRSNISADRININNEVFAY